MMGIVRLAARMIYALLLFCGACNIGVPQSTPTPPLRTPLATLSPLPTREEVIPSATATPPTVGPTPLPLFTATSQTATPLPFILRETPIFPTSPPSPTPTLLPNQSVKPLITLSPAPNPDADAPIVLLPSAIVRAEQRATSLPTIPPTVALRVTLAPQIPRDWQLTPAAGNLNELSLRSYSIDGAGNLTGGINGFLPGAPTFVRENPNPNHPVQYAARNAVGSLYFIRRDGGTERLTVSPASIYEAIEPTSNRAFIADLAWSPDGQRLSLLVHSDFSEEDGVWWLAPGRSDPQRLLVDCPRPDHPGCQIVDRSRGPYGWRTRTIQWSPDGQTLLAQVELTDTDQHPALALLQPGRDYNQLPTFLYYGYGSWLRDGDLLVSGNGPDGRNVVAVLAPDGATQSVLYADASLPLHFAHEANDGAIYALGSRAEQLALYRLLNGRAQIVSAARALPWPDFAHWDPARDVLDLTIAGRVESFSISTSASTSFLDSAGLPTGIEYDSPYHPGEQLRVRTLALNLRVEPSLSGVIITTLSQGEYVRVLAGPHSSGSEIWWQAQDAAGRIGWLASESEGQPLLERDAAG